MQNFLKLISYLYLILVTIALIKHQLPGIPLEKGNLEQNQEKEKLEMGKKTEGVPPAQRLKRKAGN